MREQDEERSLSVGRLVVVFLGVVALGAVFFSLGYFVGYKERPSNQVLNERVTSQGDVPPVANGAAGEPDSGDAEEPAAGGGSEAAPRAPASAPQEAPPPSGTPSPAVEPASAPAKPSAPDKSVVPPQVPPASTAIPEGILVQVAAVRNAQDAQSLVQLLKQHNYPAFTLTAEQAHAQDGLTRVVVGPFKTPAEAERTRLKLAGEGFKPFIRK